ncbi:MAG TPA: hypothetical protein VGE02_09910 [Gemmatimonadales bacterium]
MHHFRAFGGVLGSEIHFPELRAVAPSPPDWTLRVGVPEPFVADATVLGAQRYPGDVHVRLLQAGRRLRMETSDIGDFDLAASGDIVWRPREGASEEWARFDLLGRILPVALHMAGHLVLHGSSVALPGGGAVAFLAPKGRGKSTLALAIAQRGGRLLSDDVTVLEREGGEWRARPGVHAVRLWEDSVRGLGADSYGEPGSVGRKLVVTDLPDALRADGPAPLRAIHLLSGRAPAGGEPATRDRLGVREAALGLVRQATAGSLLGGMEGARLLARASEVARAVPVYALDVAHDFSRLDDLVARLLDWSREDDAMATTERPAPSDGASTVALPEPRR